VIDSLSEQTQGVAMFRVERLDLLSEIWEVTQAQSVLMTGSPGIGKSWAIAQFIRRCKADKRPNLAIAAEDFDIRSVDELTSALGFKREVLPFLGSLGENAVLILDGLDALRSEMSQRAFRELMGQVTDKIPQCAILASIRTFDLQQSGELQRLFFESRTNATTRQFRQVVVRPFSDADLKAVVNQIPALELLLRNCNDEFRELLRNPFNLHLAAELLESGADVQEMSLIQSQVQLLGKFWAIRVEDPPNGHDRKAVLRGVVRQMIERKALSVPEASAYTPGLSPAFKTLQSEEILRQSITDRISFTHNIFFDYAVARLVLDEEAVFEFISEDASRTIFFRPSLSFFFHYLWFKDKNLFWKVAFCFFVSVNLPERARVVAAVAIYEAAQRPEDLDPLIDSTPDIAKKGIAGILRAVQAFGGLQSGRRKLWLSVLIRLAGQVDLEFINEYVALVNIASEGTSAGEDKLIGGVARKMLRWMWGLAPSIGQENAIQLANLGAVRVFPIITKFFSSQPEESKQIVLDVMERFNSMVSGPSEAFWLANEIKSIIQNDPALAVEVYRRMFRHNETRQDKTSMGGGLVFSLTSTRQQDFSTARYGLLQGFQTFLQIAPVEAARAAIESVNAELERERQAGRDVEDASEFTFHFAGQEVTYRSDFSEIWDSGLRGHESLQLLDAALKRAAECLSADNDHTVGTRMVQEIVLRSTYATGFKRLLETAVRNCRAFYSQLFPLLTVPEFISAPETTVAVGNLLQAAYDQHMVSDPESLAVEKAISRIPEATIILRYEKPESIRNRLLMCIPQEQIRSGELKELARKLVEEKQVRENKPYHRMSGGAIPFSTEDWLRDRGADTSEFQNIRTLEAIKPLEEFERKYVNGIPSLEECAGIEPHVRRLDDLLSEITPHLAVAEHARGTLCAAAETALKNSALSKDGPLVQLCRKVVLEGAHDPSPEFNPKYHLTFDMPSWGSPLPRIEAAQGLCHFLWNWGPDDDAVGAIEMLSADKVPAVRFQVARGLLGFYKHDATGKFWTLTEQMLANESTAGVMLGLMETLSSVAGAEPERVVSLLSGAVERGLPSTERSELTRELLRILAGLYVARNDLGADKRLRQFETDPLKFHHELAEEILTASHYMRPENAEELETRSRARELLVRIVSAVYEAMQRLVETSSSENSREAFAQLLRLLDEVALRVFFTLDVDPQLRNGGAGLTDLSRRELYSELKPVIELVTLRSAIPGQHYLAPHTADKLMKTLSSVLTFDPRAVVTYAAAVCRASAKLNYHFDPSAIGEMVKFVEHVLADHKEVLRETTIANAIGDMLDIFVKAGWPEAVRLTFQLDQAIR
jgi:hypothetical protein